MPNMEMSPLAIALVVLVVAGVWALVELAVWLRGTRRAVTELSDTLNETIAEIKPVVQKLDGVADELVPAAKELTPLIERTGTAVDALTIDLVRVDDILTDVSSVTGAGANVTDAVTKITGSAADVAAGVINRLGGTAADKLADKAARLTSANAADETPSSPASQVGEVPAPSGEGRAYFTYPDAAGAAVEGADAE